MKGKSWTSFKGPHKLESVDDNKKPGTEEWSTYQTALQKRNTKDHVRNTKDNGNFLTSLQVENDVPNSLHLNALCSEYVCSLN